jgi:hypothetical protein
MGKKSLLNRLHQGNGRFLTHELELRGLDYRYSKQVADAEAKRFVDEVGLDGAYNAIKQGLIKQGDVKMLIYNEIIQRLPGEVQRKLMDPELNTSTKRISFFEC